MDCAFTRFIVDSSSSGNFTLSLAIASFGDNSDLSVIENFTPDGIGHMPVLIDGLGKTAKHHLPGNSLSRVLAKTKGVFARTPLELLDHRFGPTCLIDLTIIVASRVRG